MLIVFTHEELIINESDLINNLFESGLERLHIRKPYASKVECKRLIQQINSQYHHRIMLHQYHELAEELSCCGVHLKEEKRTQLSEELSSYLKKFQDKGFLVSSGFHHTEELVKYGSMFNYVFLSPVFDSISKQGYRGKKEVVVKLNYDNIIALGGVCSKNINEVKHLGYNGAALLGSIWNSSEPVSTFRNLQMLYSN